MKPKLTIIVPIYNNSQFLPLCLDSVKNQSFKNFECFLIDDGSTDNSLDIIKQYAKSDQRFKVFHQTNKGYGKTINFGIKKATGEYIGIVESDDFIHRDMYKKLLKHQNDIVKCSFMNFYSKKGQAIPEKVFHEVIKDFPIDGIKINPRIFLVDPTIWSAIYKREMLENNQIKLLETEGASYQDVGFQFKTFASTDNIYCLEQPLYYYRKDNDHSSVKSDQKINAVKNEFDSIDKFISNKKQFQKIADACRFRSYNWNLNRLKFKNSLLFAQEAQRDFKQKDFIPLYFIQEKHSRAYELAFSTKHPVIYVFLRPLFSGKNKIKRFIWQKISNQIL